MHQRRELASEVAIVTLDIELEIKPQAARVPVCRADKRPHAIDQHDFRVIERRRREPRKPRIAFQPPGGGKTPIECKDLGQMPNDRTFEPEVEVTDRKSLAGLTPMAAADVHPAGETNTTIDDQDFAVIAEVRIMES